MGTLPGRDETCREASADPSGSSGLRASRRWTVLRIPRSDAAGHVAQHEDLYLRWSYEGPACFSDDNLAAFLKRLPPGLLRNLRARDGGIDVFRRVDANLAE